MQTERSTTPHHVEATESILRRVARDVRESLAVAAEARAREAEAAERATRRLDEWATAMLRAADLAAAGSPGHRAALGRNARVLGKGGEAALRCGPLHRRAEIRAAIGADGLVRARRVGHLDNRGKTVGDEDAAPGEAIDRALGGELFREALAERAGWRDGRTAISDLLDADPSAADDGPLAAARALDVQERTRRTAWFGAVRNTEAAHGCAARAAADALGDAGAVAWLSDVLPGLRARAEISRTTPAYRATGLERAVAEADAPPRLLLVADVGPGGSEATLAAVETQVIETGDGSFQPRVVVVAALDGAIPAPREDGGASARRRAAPAAFRPHPAGRKARSGRAGSRAADCRGARRAAGAPPLGAPGSGRGARPRRARRRARIARRTLTRAGPSRSCHRPGRRRSWRGRPLGHTSGGRPRGAECRTPNPWPPSRARATPPRRR